jgi:hypothetical protein
MATGMIIQREEPSSWKPRPGARDFKFDEHYSGSQNNFLTFFTLFFFKSAILFRDSLPFLADVISITSYVMLG